VKRGNNSATDLAGQSSQVEKNRHAADRNQTAPPEIEKAKVHIVIEIIEYVPNAVVSKTIIKKTTGNVTVTSFDAGEELAEKTSPFDNYIQIVDGAAEVTINEKKSVVSR
jgi:quercetin dioxygenase-like cupin family protein